MPDPFDDYLRALRSAADLYVTDHVASRIAAVSATISFLRAAKPDRSLTTPLIDLLGHLEDERLRRTADGRLRRMGNTKPVIASVKDALVSAVITLAVRTGKTKQQAAVMVAQQIGIGAHDPEGIRRLLQSRKNLMNKRASREALNTYDLMISKAAEAGKAGVSPHDALHKGLDFLREKIMAQSA